MSLAMIGKGKAGGRRRPLAIAAAAGSPSVGAGARTTTTVAAWTYDGKSHDVSIQEADYANGVLSRVTVTLAGAEE